MNAFRNYALVDTAGNGQAPSARDSDLTVAGPSEYKAPGASGSLQRDTSRASRQALAQLLSHCAAGDRRSFERLYRETSSQLFGLVMRIVKNPDLAGEVLQEGYVKIWLHAGEFCADKAAPMTWMGAIVRHQAIDLIRRAGCRPANTEPVEMFDALADEGAGPLDLAIRTEQEGRVYNGLEHLPETQRRAVVLAYFHGLTHEELAHYLDKPLGTVKSWVRRGVRRLREANP